MKKPKPPIPNLDTPLRAQLVFKPVPWSPPVPEDEPTQEEIYRRAAELRETWDEQQMRRAEGCYATSKHPAAFQAFSARIFGDL